MLWVDRAACGGHDPVPWTSEPELDKKQVAVMRDFQRLMCAACPVEFECARDAYLNRDQEQYRARHWLPDRNSSKDKPHQAAMRALKNHANQLRTERKTA